MKDANNNRTMGILIKPIVTEKMTVQGDKLNRYGFLVDRNANKLEIKKAVEQMYGVSVLDVNTANYRGTVSYTHLDSAIRVLCYI